MKKDYTFYVPSAFMPIHINNLISPNFNHIFNSFAQSDQEVISSSVNGSASSLQLGRSRSFSASDQQKLLGSTMTSGDWQQLLDSASNRTSFRSSTSGNLAASCGISVEPTKGALALQGVGLATSHCLEQFSSDPAFAERAAKYSSFGNAGTYSSSQMISQPLPFMDSERSRAGNQLEDEEARIVDAAGATENDNMDHVSKAGQGTTSREEDFSCTADQEHAAACRSVESSDDTGNKRKIETSQYSDAGKETNTGEPLSASCKLQDYVHVRARRGQATDSHSLAERVRREKISERMKYLQDLVPGCSKVTGKAVMLDEIINYVQSLQHQVEVLSMKLASVNPQLDYNLDCIFNKEMLQSGASSIVGPEPSSTYELHLPLTPPHIANGLEFQSLGTMDSCHLRRTISAPPTGVPSVSNLDTFGDDATQMSIEWDGELQSMLQMGFGQATGATSSLLLEGFNNCQLPAGHMKVEL
ncbi:unnamed protein product [Sphagnum jensenii]|uniref:BHLH domain-containing protein n=1 Tax=Sphagnum jensenii TaxID=128206 RepID=A0ABP0X8D1_9BRYO